MLTRPDSKVFIDHDAKLAWMGLVGYIVAYDLFAIKTGHKTLSAGFSNGMKHKIGRVAIVGAWAIVTKHLIFNERGKVFDPIQLAADKLRGKWHG